jgi:ATP-binding cassette subfamily C protein
MFDQSGDFSIDKDSCVKCSQDILWIKSEKGQFLYAGNENAQIKEGDQPLPINRSIYIKTISKCSFSLNSTEQIFEQPDILNILTSFSHTLYFFINDLVDKKKQNEKERLQKRTQNDSVLEKNSLLKLSSILEEGISEYEGESIEPLVYAFQVLGNYIGKKVKVPEDINRESFFDDIVKNSDFAIRKVLLKDNWFKQDNGPMIAWFEKDHQPVALIPDTPSRYMVYSAGEQKYILSEEKAYELEPQAYMIYTTFPDTVISIMELVKFSLKASWKRDKISIIVMGIMAGLMGAVTPVVTGKLIDTVIPSADRGQLATFAAVLLSSATAAFIFQMVKAISLLRVEGKTDGAVQAAVWTRLLNLPPTFFKDYSTGDLAQRAMGINAIRQLLSGTTLNTIMAGLFSGFNLFLMFYYDKKLAFLGFGLTLLALIFSVSCSVKSLKISRELIQLEGKISSLVFQLLKGVAKFRVAGAENRAFYLWSEKFSRKKELAFSDGKLQNYIQTFNSFFPIIASVSIFSFLYIKGERDEATLMLKLTTGQFLAFNAAFTAFLAAMLNLAESFTSVFDVIPFYQRSKPILECEPEINEGKPSPGRLAGNIEISHVSFKYDEKGPLILDDVSFEIKPGEFVALVGPSGSGKSTLFRILLGFEFPESGTVNYDGQDISTIDVKALRRQLGVVLQNGQLMAGDIFTNIVGSRNLTIDHAWEAARNSGLDEDINYMPMGMHTVVSEGAGTLSGGQKQRILIAKAIVHKPRILYFDEATSALDNKTQSIVSQSIEKLQATRVVIAHRLSTIKNADKIIVIEAGKLVQQGTFEELVNVPGTFQDLAKRQMV